MDIFLKYIMNVCRFLRNRSQFCFFIVIFELSTWKVIRNGYYYLRSTMSVKICFLVQLLISKLNGLVTIWIRVTQSLLTGVSCVM